MAHPRAKLGFFDSGIGGLSVVRAVRRRLPNESLVYIADSVNCPYGARAPEEIICLAQEISRYLIEQDVKVVIVACNTASAAALGHLRQTYPDIPFVGMVPAVKTAVQLTSSKVIGVLATPNTLHGKLYEDVVAQYAEDVRVIATVCPGLVELVEMGQVEGELVEKVLHSCIDPLLDAGVDTLVLGCTHYPFLIPTIERLYGSTLQVLEPSEAVARQVERVLRMHHLLAPQGATASQFYYSTGNCDLLQNALKQYLGYAGKVEALTWVNDHLRSEDIYAQ